MSWPGRDRAALKAAARGLYEAIVAQARRPEFYVAYGVPDTLAGRFDMVVLHAWLVIRRLRAEAGEGAATAQGLAQALFDLFCADMDQNLRQMGVGDLGVGRRVKTMAKGFYGRAAAYDAGLAADGDLLAAAIRRNLYGSVDEAAPPPAPVLAAMAAYLRQAAQALAAERLETLLAGGVRFAAPPPVGAPGPAGRFG